MLHLKKAQKRITQSFLPNDAESPEGVDIHESDLGAERHLIHTVGGREADAPSAPAADSGRARATLRCAEGMFEWNEWNALLLLGGKQCLGVPFFVREGGVRHGQHYTVVDVRAACLGL